MLRIDVDCGWVLCINADGGDDYDDDEFATDDKKNDAFNATTMSSSMTMGLSMTVMTVIDYDDIGDVW